MLTEIIKEASPGGDLGAGKGNHPPQNGLKPVLRRELSFSELRVVPSGR